MRIFDLIICSRCRGHYAATTLLCNYGHWTCALCLQRTQLFCGYTYRDGRPCGLSVPDEYYVQISLIRSYFCRLNFDGEAPFIGKFIVFFNYFREKVKLFIAKWRKPVDDYSLVRLFNREIFVK